MNTKEEIVWINGDYTPSSQAKVSIFDRGLLFADAVYEVFLLHDGKIFDFNGHYQRLVRSLEFLNIENPFSEKALHSIINSLIKKNDFFKGDYGVYLQISRGNQNPRNAIYSDNLDASSTNCFMNLFKVNIHRKLKIIKVALAKDTRWALATIKTNNLLANSMILSEAYKKQGFEEVILHKNGLITEATSSNFFMVKGGIIHTPKLTDFILPGTTRRQIIINIAKDLGIEVCEREILLSEIEDDEKFNQIDEMWVSSSTKLVWSINQIENKNIDKTDFPIASSILSHILKKIDQT